MNASKTYILILFIFIFTSCSKNKCDTNIVGEYYTSQGDYEFTESYYITPNGIQNAYTINCEEICITFDFGNGQVVTDCYEYENKKNKLSIEGSSEDLIRK
jgi:hypothetical protein